MSGGNRQSAGAEHLPPPPPPVPQSTCIPVQDTRVGGGVPIGNPHLPSRPQLLPLGQLPVQQHPFQQGPAHPQPHYVPVNPRPLQHSQAPAERRHRHGVQISDLRSENMTEADARQQLSSIIVIRMEKKYNPNEVDEEGRPLLPSWDRVIRTEETDISQTEAVRKVRDLNKHTAAVADKKFELPTLVQRQIERAQESLEMDEEDSRYEYVLAQLEFRTREIDESSPLYRIHGSKLNKKDSKRDKKMHKTSAKNKGYKEKLYKSDKPKHSRVLERVSVTVYFKRVPRKAVDAMRMLHQRLLPRLPSPHRSMPPEPPPQPLPQPPTHPQSQPMPNPSHISIPVPSIQPGPPMAHQQPMNLPLPPQGFPMPAKPLGLPLTPMAEIKPAGGSRAPKIYQEKPRSSRDSVTSEDSWDLEGSVYITPESSLGSATRKHHKRKGKYYRHHQKHPWDEFRPNTPPRNHNTKDDNYYGMPMTPPPAPPSPRLGPLPRDIDLDSIRKKAFEQGRESVLTPLPPLVIQPHGPAKIRAVSPYEARRAMHRDLLGEIDDTLERVHIDNESRRGRSYTKGREYHADKLEDAIRGGHTTQGRMNRREMMDDCYMDYCSEPEPCWPAAQTQQYMRSRERGEARLNPLAPAGPY